MRTRSAVAAALLLAAGCSEGAAPPSGPRAEPVEASRRGLKPVTDRYNVRGDYANATFTIRSPTNYCVETTVQVDGSTWAAPLEAGPGKPGAQSFAGVLVSEVDLCSGQELRLIYGETKEPIFRALGTKAWLQGTMQGVDRIRDKEGPVQVDVTWSGTGGYYNVSDHYRLVTPGVMIIERYKGPTVDAMTTGTVAFEGENFTQDDTTYGNIGHPRSGRLEITRWWR